MAQHPYQRVYDDLRSRIGPDREFPPGAKLPTRKELCARYGVSHAIADRVMWLLAQDGVTETLHGSGVYVREVE